MERKGERKGERTGERKGKRKVERKVERKGRERRGKGRGKRRGRERKGERKGEERGVERRGKGRGKEKKKRRKRSGREGGGNRKGERKRRKERGDWNRGESESGRGTRYRALFMTTFTSGRQLASYRLAIFGAVSTGGTAGPSLTDGSGRITVSLSTTAGRPLHRRAGTRHSQQGELLITVRQDRGVGGKGKKVEKDREKEKGGRADRKKEK